MNSLFLKFRLARIGRRVTADPRLKASIRAHLVQAGYVSARVSPWTQVRMVTASASALFLGLGGMASYAYASDAVLPDTPLYPVRQGIEALEVKLAPTPEVRAKVIEKQVQRRQKEAHLLEAMHKPLPQLHAKVLKEEREKQEEREADRSLPTGIRRGSAARSHGEIIRNAQDDEEKDRDDRQEDKAFKRSQRSLFLAPSSTQQMFVHPISSTSRSLLPDTRFHKEKDPEDSSQQEQKKSQKRSRHLERSKGEQRP